MRKTKIVALGIDFPTIASLTTLLGLKGSYSLSKIKNIDEFVMNSLNISDYDVAQDYLKQLIKNRDVKKLLVNKEQSEVTDKDLLVFSFLKTLYLSVDSNELLEKIKMFYAAKEIKFSEQDVLEFKRKIEDYLQI